MSSSRCWPDFAPGRFDPILFRPHGLSLLLVGIDACRAQAFGQAKRPLLGLLGVLAFLLGPLLGLLGVLEFLLGPLLGRFGVLAVLLGPLLGLLSLLFRLFGSLALLLDSLAF